MTERRRRPTVSVLGALTVAVSLGSVCAAGSPRVAQNESPRAAARYVPDRQCEGCHRDIAETFSEVGMSRSFARPRRADLIEPLGDDSRFDHEPSGRRYSMRWEDGRLVFRRSRPLAGGAEADVVELTVDWVLGSGNKARTYLVGNQAGELHQLPIAWYPPEDRWAMAPGFEGPDHPGLQRRVLRECMFCHNAYPQQPGEEGDAWDDPDLFPERLPEGIGCQRCHGPGSEHVAQARAGAAPEGLRASIVNPARLSPERRDDVCDACHLQPTVAVFGVRREGRTDYSWQPGQRLDDYVAKIDVEERGLEREDRFEINHHAYRLRQSECFLASGRDLSCLTCHDPHRKITAERDPEHFRQACLGCHRRAAAERAEDGYHEAWPDGSCVSCHMPQRRTSDVIHAVMTDHRIALPPADPEQLVVPREARDPDIDDVFLTGVPPERRRDADVERLLAVLEVVPHSVVAERLETVLVDSGATEARPWLALGVAQLRLGQLDRARHSLQKVLDARPGHWLAQQQMAVVLARGDDRGGGLALLDRAIAVQPRVPDLHYNRGLLLLGEGRNAEALVALERAVELRPTLAAGWAYLGVAQQRLGEGEEAERSFDRANSFDPGNAIVARHRRVD